MSLNIPHAHREAINKFAKLALRPGQSDSLKNAKKRAREEYKKMSLDQRNKFINAVNDKLGESEND